ncbi:MAG: MBOAT family O-acyltransferase, partial [Bacteroidia bacterium]
GSSDFISNFIVPAGLSFYTFQSLSYTIDVYRGIIAAEKNAMRFALFVSFFPQLVAGPVERYSHLSGQLAHPKVLTNDALASAGRIMIWGFFKKIAIADRLSAYVDPLFAAPENFGGLTLALGGLVFVVQVYCDFSGYTDIATGTARLFGVELMLNYRRSLLSRSLHEFWQRNHISMTNWFRDYVYRPLGGNRAAPWRVQFNLLLTFLISGLWHGASWAFVIWGALHGLVYILERAVMNRRKKAAPALLKFPGWLWFIAFHSLSIIAFRAGTTDVLQDYTAQLWNGSWSLHTAYSDFRHLHDLFPLLIAAAVVALLFAKELQEEYGWLRGSKYYATAMRPAFYIGVFVLLFFIGEFGAKAFIYFSF